MEAAEILAAISATRAFVAFLIQQAELGNQQGKFTPEQMAEIQTEAGISDGSWDAAVADAKKRIGG